jgi:F-box protein 11
MPLEPYGETRTSWAGADSSLAQVVGARRDRWVLFEGAGRVQMSEGVRGVLGELLARFGPGLAEDPRRLEALLRDLAGEDRQAIFLLVSAARERVPERLTGSGGSLPAQLLISALARDLQQSLGLADSAAHWAVESWAVALGITSAAATAAPTAGSAVTQPQAPAAAPAPPAGVLVVAAAGEADHRSIAAALTAAKPGGRILVRPGVYRESLVLDKPTEIAGDGPREEILLIADNAACLLMRTDNAHVRGLTLRRRAGENVGAAVDIERGTGVVLMDCDITSESSCCIAIYGAESSPIVRCCRIHDGKTGEIFVYDSGRGTVEDCDITGNASAGVQIRSGGDLTVRGCRIRDHKGFGVVAGLDVEDESLLDDAPTEDNGRGTVEDCDITGNVTGVGIGRGTDLIVRSCRIRDNEIGGVGVLGNGQGTIEDCDISGNGVGVGAEEGPAIEDIKDEFGLKVRACRIHDNKEQGIQIMENGRILVQDCDIYGAALGGVEISTGSDPTVRGCRIHDCKTGGILVRDNGRGMVEDCDIYGNAFSGVEVKTGGDPTVRGCRIHDGKQDGIFVYDNGQGMVEDCDIYGNAFSGVEVKTGGDPTVRGCRINNNTYTAINVHDGGRGIFEDNNLTGNRTGAWYVDRPSKRKVRTARNRE